MNGNEHQSYPLCVDFDGSLIRTDSLYECFVAALRSRPFGLLRALPIALRSRAEFKSTLWRLARDLVNVSSLPREPKVVDLIDQARSMGRRVELVSAADIELLKSDPTLAGMFDDIIGSDGDTNLKGANKAAALKQRHPSGFEYVGDSIADVPVFEASTKGYGVGLSQATERALAERSVKVERLVPSASPLGAFIRSMRLHQWFKNILIFVPIGLSLATLSTAEIARVVTGFVLLGLLASATYMINDLFDLQSDRRHPRKSKRPLASGDLPLVFALVGAPAMIFVALTLGFLLVPSFGAVLALYLAVTLAYSFRLKQTPVIDVMVLGVLFSLRVVAGMALGNAPASQWLLVFSVFFFTGLALMKRDAEIALRATSQQQALEGRGYMVGDRPFVQIAGISTSIASLIIFALFIVTTFEEGRQYSAPYFLWAAYLLLAYWMLRLWFISFRGAMNDDPIEFAIKEPKSLSIFLAIGVVCILAQIL